MFLWSTFILCLAIFLYCYRWWGRSRLNNISTIDSDIFPFGHAFLALNCFSRNHLHTKLLEIAMGCCKYLSRDGMFYLRIFHKNAVVLTSADAVKDLLASKTHLTKTDLYEPVKIFWGEGLITTSNISRWKCHRKFVYQHFNHQELEKYQLVMNRQSAVLCGILNTIPAGSTMCFYQYICSCIVDISIESVTGYNPRCQLDTDAGLVRMFERLEELVIQTIPNPLARLDILYFKIRIGKEYHELAKKYRFFFQNILEKRRAEVMRKAQESHSEGEYDYEQQETTSVMDSFLFDQLKNKSFTDVEIVDELATLVSAGFSTTTVAVAWTFYYIGYYPEVQKKVQQELDSIFGTDCEREVTTQDMAQMKYLSAVHKESLRLSPPVPILGRKVTNDTVIHGKNLPKGTQVGFIIPAVHRDPKYYENPEHFQPERFSPENAKNIPPHAFIPYSFGPRNCLGSTFATKSALVILSSVLRKFEVKSLQHRDQLPIMWGVIAKPEFDVLSQLVPRTVSAG